MNVKFGALKKLGAGEFEHLNGSLIEHLNGTYTLLKQWNASSILCDAGLYHAAYGTAGFDSEVVPLSRRSDIAKIIGADAEAIVYLYCSCDRDYVFSRIGQSEYLNFKDRFTGDEFVLSQTQAQQFCELTVANELELALTSVEFKKKHGEGLYGLFAKFTPYLTSTAINAVNDVLALD